VLALIIVGPEGDILQCDMFAKRASEHYCIIAPKAETGVALLFPACISRRWMAGGVRVVFGRVLACLEHDSPNE
jgi:hypothetical protein